MSDGPGLVASAAPPGSDEAADAARRLFRYLYGDEWREHRAVMGVFAGTFFSEFTPEEVTARLARAGVTIELAVVTERLESLRRWGNLAISSSIGNPTSVADYYRLRNRYLITSAGQEVHDLVEGVLVRVDEVRDISTGRLRAMLDGLAALAEADLAGLSPSEVADLVRAVFDPHQAFTGEITQFFAEINHWQSRYDLSAEEFAFFAEVLVGYVADRLDEIERTSRPIGRRLSQLAGRAPEIVARMGGDLASRVEEAGLAGTVAVRRGAGSTVDDWDHLVGWFVAGPGGPSRIARLGKEAVAAIRTLTLNLTRLSRVGVAASSRRADLLRLAAMLAAEPAGPGVARIAAAALGLHPADHYGVPAADSDDPAGSSTSWWDAPRAPVPLSIRERGDTSNRGRTTPMADRAAAQRLIRHQRHQEAEGRRRVDSELLEAGPLDGARLTTAGLARLQQLVGRNLASLGVRAAHHVRTEDGIRCTVRRVPGTMTVVTCPEGRLTFADLAVEVASALVAPPDRG